MSSRALPCEQHGQPSRSACGWAHRVRIMLSCHLLAKAVTMFASAPRPFCAPSCVLNLVPPAGPVRQAGGCGWPCWGVVGSTEDGAATGGTQSLAGVAEAVGSGITALLCACSRQGGCECWALREARSWKCQACGRRRVPALPASQAVGFGSCGRSSAHSAQPQGLSQGPALRTGGTICTPLGLVE